MTLDEPWQIQRKHLECSFQPKIIQSFTSTFAECADQMIDSLTKQVVTNDSVDIFSVTSRCSLTMVLATSFGLSAAEVEFSDEILKAVEE